MSTGRSSRARPSPRCMRAELGHPHGAVRLSQRAGQRGRACGLGADDGHAPDVVGANGCVQVCPHASGLARTSVPEIGMVARSTNTCATRCVLETCYRGRPRPAIRLGGEHGVDLLRRQRDRVPGPRFRVFVASISGTTRTSTSGWISRSHSARRAAGGSCSECRPPLRSADPPARPRCRSSGGDRGAADRTSRRPIRTSYRHHLAPIERCQSRRPTMHIAANATCVSAVNHRPATRTARSR